MAKKRSSAEQVMYRQGDVLITRVAAIPGDAKERKRDNGRVILAYGEVTGHAHAIADSPQHPRAALFDVPARNGSSVGTRSVDGAIADTDLMTFLRVDELSELVHDEHSMIVLAPGDYRVTRQREYQPEAPRWVGD